MCIQFKMLTIFAICLFIVGCYTMISHPRLSDEMITESEYIDQDVSYIDECSQCHENYHQFQAPYTDTFHAFDWEGYDYYDWQYYYDIPWWQEERYYISVSRDEGDESLPPTHKRDFNRRGSSESGEPVSSRSDHQAPPSHLSKQSGSSSTESVQENSTEPQSDKRTTDRRETKSHEGRKKSPPSTEAKKKKE